MLKPSHFLVSLPLALAVGFTLVSVDTEPVNAQPADSTAVDADPEAATEARHQRRADRQARLRAAHEVHRGRSTRSEPTSEPCAEGLISWRRGKDVSLCATPCSTDTDCASFERCRVLSWNAGPTSAPRFSDEEPISDASPGTAVCDPFYDVEGAMTATMNASVLGEIEPPVEVVDEAL